MIKILKIQGIIFLLLSIISWIGEGNPFPPLTFILTAFIAPVMLVSYNWGVETFFYAFIIILFTMSMMIYGYKQRDKKRGIITFIVGFWLYAFASLLFVGSHF